MSLFQRRHSVWPVNSSNTNIGVVRKQVARPRSALYFSARRCVPDVCSRSVRLVTLALIPTTALIICVALALSEASTQSRSSNQVKDLLSNSLEQVGDLVHCLQVERGTTVLYVSSEKNANLLPSLLNAYKATDAEIRNLTNWRQIDITDQGNAQYSYFETKVTFHEHILKYRHNISLNQETSREALSFYSEVIEKIIEWFWDDFSTYQNGDEWPSLVAYQLIILAKEQIGIERALGGRFFALGGFEDPDEYFAYMDRSTKGNTFLEEALLFSEEFGEFYIGNILQSNLYSRITEMKSEILINNFTYIEPNVVEGSKWFVEMSDYIDLLLQAQYVLTDVINEDLDRSISYRKKVVIFATILLVVSVLLSPFILHKIAHQARQIEDIADKLGKQAIQLSEEKARANRLLYQMLPCEIAESLKSSWDVAAEAFEQATIFFSDVVNFTSLCAECAPMQVVAMLNSLYQTLDTKIELYDVYKIETIGDAYVVVSGVPRRNGDRHVYEMGCLAIDIRDTVGKLPIPHIPNECFQLRIGLHTGPCAAGVVGHKMPRYCLFGDSVNTAARMESTGKPSKIHISPSTFTAIQNYADVFITEPRGTVYVKGKGRMETHWLIGKHQETYIITPENGANQPILNAIVQTPAIDVTYVNIPDYQDGGNNPA